MFGHHRSLTEDQTISFVFVHSRIILGSLEGSRNALASFVAESSINQHRSRSAAQCKILSFLCSCQRDPRFDVDSALRFALFAIPLPPPCDLFAGLGIQSLIRVPSGSFFVRWLSAQQPTAPREPRKPRSRLDDYCSSLEKRDATESNQQRTW